MWINDGTWEKFTTYIYTFIFETVFCLRKLGCGGTKYVLAAVKFYAIIV